MCSCSDSGDFMAPYRTTVTGDPRPARSAADGASVLTAGLGAALLGTLSLQPHAVKESIDVGRRSEVMNALVLAGR